MLKSITRFAANPIANITIAIITLFCAISDLYEDISGDDMTLGAHHGLIIFAGFHFFKTLPELFHAIDLLEKGETELEQAENHHKPSDVA